MAVTTPTGRVRGVHGLARGGCINLPDDPLREHQFPDHDGGRKDRRRHAAQRRLTLDKSRPASKPHVNANTAKVAPAQSGMGRKGCESSRSPSGSSLRWAQCPYVRRKPMSCIGGRVAVNPAPFPCSPRNMRRGAAPGWMTPRLDHKRTCRRAQPHRRRQSPGRAAMEYRHRRAPVGRAECADAARRSGEEGQLAGQPARRCW